MKSLCAAIVVFLCCAAIESAIAAVPEHDGEQHVRIDVPTRASTADAAAIGDESPLSHTPQAQRRRSIRLGRQPVFATPVPRVHGTAMQLRNRLHAPVTVEILPGDRVNTRLSGEVPERVTLAPLETREVLLVQGIDALQPGSADFVLTSAVGDPAAQPDAHYRYAWPLSEPKRSRITQTFGGPTHNEPFSHYAIDIAAPEGTPVITARAGVVVFLEDRYFESGLDRASFRDKANHVRILHDDGSMATYAHLAPDSVDVIPGQRVEVGSVIGRSGNTGFSSGPHLHFAVLVNRDMELVSIPFRMKGVALPTPKP